MKELIQTFKRIKWFFKLIVTSVPPLNSTPKFKPFLKNIEPMIIRISVPIKK